MNRISSILLIGILVSCSNTPNPQPQPQPQPGPVLSELSIETLPDSCRVIDGDTISCFLDGQQESIRLCGVDAYERTQEGGDAATAALERHLNNSGITFTRGNRDRYGRIISSLFTKEGESINAALVEGGHAFMYTTYVGGCADEQFIREAQLNNPAVPGIELPWDYRRNR